MASGTLQGFAVGALGLAALQALLSSSRAGAVSGLLALPGTFAQHFLDPTRPAIGTAPAPPGTYGPYGTKPLAATPATTSPAGPPPAATPATAPGYNPAGPAQLA